ncbi:MAG: hypothetical protein V1755_11020 [Chloroflexota bacterium]
MSGNIGSLPEYPQPPTPTPSNPAAPSNFQASTSCSPTGLIFVKNLHVELTWTDNATNEEGYRVYRRDELVYTLSANSTGVEDDTTISIIILATPVPGTPPGVKYSIRAFNGSGNSEWRELYAQCP